MFKITRYCTVIHAENIHFVLPIFVFYRILETFYKVLAKFP